MRPFLTLAAAAAFFMPVAHGAAFCAPHDHMLALLELTYQQRRVALAVTDAGSLIELLATEDGANWTIVVTEPNGRTCIVATSQGGRSVRPEAPET